MKVNRKRAIRILVCLLMAAMGVGVDGEVYWQYTYDGDVLPNDADAIVKVGGGTAAFALSNYNANVVYLNGDGTLTINDLAAPGNYYCSVDAATGLWATPVTIEIRMSMAQSTGNNSWPLILSNGTTTHYEWHIYEGIISGSRSVALDMTQLRTMRIAFDASGATLYLDNNGTIEAIGAYIRTVAEQYITNKFIWGDTVSNATGVMTVDYVYWLTGAAYDFDTTINTIGPADCGFWGILPEDLNQDCAVNLADLAILIGDWLSCTDPQGVGCVHPL